MEKLEKRVAELESIINKHGAKFVSPNGTKQIEIAAFDTIAGVWADSNQYKDGWQSAFLHAGQQTVVGVRNDGGTKFDTACFYVDTDVAGKIQLSNSKGECCQFTGDSLPGNILPPSPKITYE
jgi:hypothetical protein